MKDFILFACFIATVSAACRECGEDEISCPSGGLDIDGCPKYLTCYKFWQADTGYDGTFCPFHCPNPCNGLTERYCPGSMDGNGCRTAPSCIHQPAANDRCPNTYCPIDCSVYPGNLVNCPGELDHRGCPTEDTCIPADEFCPTHH